MPIEQTFGINYFFYALITPERKLSFIGTNIELVQHYFDAKMHMVYPFLLNTKDVKTGIYLYDSVPSEEFQTTLQQLEQKYQVKHSCLIARQDKQGCHLFGMAVPPHRKGYASLFLNESTMLKKFTIHFEDEMRKVIAEMKGQAIDLTSFDEETAKCKDAHQLPDISLNRSKKMQFLQKLDDFYSDNLKFTSREVDIIKPFLEGKPAREIAELICLSPRTVEHYLEGLKDKLCCYTKSELFESLNELNSLHLI